MYVFLSDWLTWSQREIEYNVLNYNKKCFDLKNIILVIFNASFYFGKFVASHSTQYVTYGSVIKLLNTDYNVRLHSHDVKYGTGSGQQSITGTELMEDLNSHWTIVNITNAPYQRGLVFLIIKDFVHHGHRSVHILMIFSPIFVHSKPVKCGDVIRLQHLSTSKNLHSHHFSSPLSGNQEISCYGEDGTSTTLLTPFSLD